MEVLEALRRAATLIEELGTGPGPVSGGHIVILPGEVQLTLYRIGKSAQQVYHAQALVSFSDLGSMVSPWAALEHHIRRLMRKLEDPDS